MSKKIALFLSGSGHLDGTEITEAVSLLIALSKYSASVDFFAPDRNQSDVVNHTTQTILEENRNILTESARIARGKIRSLSEFKANDYDAIVLPGGFGAVKNFTNFTTKGNDAVLNADIKEALLTAITQKKWLVGICAAPLVLALAMKKSENFGATVTFGHHAQAADFIAALTHWNIKHIDSDIHGHHIDFEHKLITSGAYMFHDASPYDIYQCSDSIIKQLIEELSKQ